MRVRLPSGVQVERIVMPYNDKQKQREYQRLWYNKRRADWLSDKSCVICGSTERLEVDHIDPRQKVRHNIWSYSEARRQEELDKCQVLCWEHHNEKTARDNNIPVAYTHGTRNMYGRHGCRCDECKAANSESVRKRRSKK
jgi:hypothetical protein